MSFTFDFTGDDIERTGDAGGGGATAGVDPGGAERNDATVTGGGGVEVRTWGLDELVSWGFFVLLFLFLNLGGVVCLRMW